MDISRVRPPRRLQPIIYPVNQDGKQENEVKTLRPQSVELQVYNEKTGQELSTKKTKKHKRNHKRRLKEPEDDYPLIRSKMDIPLNDKNYTGKSNVLDPILPLAPVEKIQNPERKAQELLLGRIESLNIKGDSFANVPEVLHKSNRQSIKIMPKPLLEYRHKDPLHERKITQTISLTEDQQHTETHPAAESIDGKTNENSMPILKKKSKVRKVKKSQNRRIENGTDICTDRLEITHTGKQKYSEIPLDHIGIWKLGEEDCFVTVPEEATIEECKTKAWNKLRNCNPDDLHLWDKNRCIFLDEEKSLADYPGLSRIYIIRRPHSRKPHPAFLTSLPDLIDPCEEDQRVLTPCGHAITPDNLYQYAWSKVKDGAAEITCPAIPDMDLPVTQCSATWHFSDVSLLACLSLDEQYLFSKIIFSNWLEKQSNVFLCPNCHEALESDKALNGCIKCCYCSCRFCTKCSSKAKRRDGVLICSNTDCQACLPAVRTLLKTCSTRIIIGVECPSVRTCPKCGVIIEYGEIDSCKHMTCPRNTCKTDFCFICLKIKTERYRWPCGGAFEACSPAPRQTL